MNRVTLQFRRLFLAKLILISTFAILLSLNESSFAQDKGNLPKTVDKKIEEPLDDDLGKAIESGDQNNAEQAGDNNQTSEPAPKEESKPPEPVIPEKQQSDFFRVLGREATLKEKQAYGKLTQKQIEEQFLYRESTLAPIRALLAIGEAKNISILQQYLQYEEPRTYLKWIEYFTDLKEKYGSVEKGINAEKNLRLSEKQIFEGTALKAYKIVYGVSEEALSVEDREQLFNFLKGKEATTLSKMVAALVKSMTPDEKKDLLFGLLDEINRPDLKKKSEFTGKILKQEVVTYEYLKELLKELKK